MRSPLSRSALLLLCATAACGPQDEVDEQDAAALANEYSAGAGNATDPVEAQILQERADTLRESSRGSDEAEENVTVTGE